MQSKKQRKEDFNNSNSKIKCSSCGRDINFERYFRCSRCINFIQCLDCYSVDCSCHTEHNLKDYIRNYHKFFIVDPNPVPLFRTNWDSNEEILLLNAVKLLGVGNWNSIAEWLKPRTANEIEAHYFQTYFDPLELPYPFNEIKEPAIIPQPPSYNPKPIESCPSEGHDSKLALKNKKEKTTPAEYSGWMPYRHEFDVEYFNDAEDIVANIDFLESNSIQVFEEKIRCLKVYNQSLKERRFRTKVIEDWDIQHLEIRPNQNKSEKELDNRILNSNTKIEKEIDEKILPLAPYIGKNETQELADNLHRRIKLNAFIETRLKWQKNGVKSISEGQLLSELEKLIKDGKILPNDIDLWNKTIETYIRKNKRDSQSPELELLTEKELDLCQQNKIHTQFFFAIKDLIIREFTIRGYLSKKEIISTVPEISNYINIIYDYLIDVGLISN